MKITNKLRFFDITMMVISLVIGMGIFRAPATVALRAGNETLFYAAWILGGGIVFLCSRYLATTLNTAFARHIRRITNIPVFQVTSGDVNRMTAYLSKSHNSMFRLAGTGVAYGAFKALGLYFATYLIRHLAT